MSDSNSSASLAAIHQLLSELLDTVQLVKQAQWRLQLNEALHSELEDLHAGLAKWGQLLLEEDKTLGGSPLSAIPTSSGRTPRNFWPGQTSEEEIRLMLAERLDELSQHVAVTLANQQDDGVRAALIAVERGLLKHRQRLSQVST